MKKQNKKNVKKTKQEETKKEKARRFCKDCRFYDPSIERDFQRKVGKRDPETSERAVIKEVRMHASENEMRAFYSIFQNIFPQLQLTIAFGVSPFLRLTVIVAPQELQVNKSNKSLKATTTGTKSFLLNSTQRL